MYSKVTKLPIDDYNFLKEWFLNKNNILSCLPKIKTIDNNYVLLDFGFLTKIKFTFYTISNGKYIEHRFLDNEENRKLRVIVLLGEEPELRVSYEGEDTSGKIGKFLDEFFESIKGNLLSDFSKRKEIQVNLSKELMKASFLGKIVTTSKPILEEEKELNDVLEYVESLLERFHNYPMLYIRGISSDSSFRLLFINGELKGVYIKIGKEDSVNELDLVKLSGKYQIRVYARNNLMIF